MKTREIFLRTRWTWRLVNEGVSSNNIDDLDTLRFELDSFVCEGEYLNGMRLILQAYRRPISVARSRKQLGSAAFTGVGNPTWQRFCAIFGSTSIPGRSDCTVHCPPARRDNRSAHGNLDAWEAA